MPFDHFDIIAHLYNRVGPFSAPGLLYDMLNLSSDGVLLDAGGGTGRVAEALQCRVRDVVVADLSRGMLSHAASKGLSTACSKTEQLPFASSSFEHIIMVDALHHVFDQRQTSSELWRVLKPGGRIIIIEPNILKFVVKLIAFGEKILLMRSHFLPPEEIVALFTNLNSHVQLISKDNDAWVCVEKVREL